MHIDQPEKHYMAVEVNAVQLFSIFVLQSDFLKIIRFFDELDKNHIENEHTDGKHCLWSIRSLAKSPSTSTLVKPSSKNHLNNDIWDSKSRG